MAAASDMVYETSNIAEPMAAQYNFAAQYNLDDPEQARSNYQRIMHEHTMQQFQLAHDSARRRTSGSHHTDDMTLNHESSIESVASSDA